MVLDIEMTAPDDHGSRSRSIKGSLLRAVLDVEVVVAIGDLTGGLGVLQEARQLRAFSLKIGARRFFPADGQRGVENLLALQDLSNC